MAMMLLWFHVPFEGLCRRIRGYQCEEAVFRADHVAAGDQDVLSCLRPPYLE